MKKDLTELVFILDRSGSMAGLEKDTVGGFNAMLERQKGEAGECLVSTVLFDSGCVVLHDRLPLETVPPMTQRDYAVGGCTALLDAVGGAIRHIAGIHRYARPEDVPERTVFVITTDGMENASRFFRRDEVRAMISREREKYGWEFLFLAANIDAEETAAHLGVDRERAVNYHADTGGTAAVYEAVSEAVSTMRSRSPLGTGWRKALDEDFRTRKK